MPPGEANIARAQVTLPKSEFLDNSHIRTVCTRVQYRAEACPAGSVYGHGTAYTPLLDEPLERPRLPAIQPRTRAPRPARALHSSVADFDLVGRVDSVGEGQIRNTFEAVPDAPVSRFVLEMDGGPRGLLENSPQPLPDRSRAIVRFVGQNGKIRDFKPRVKPKGCGKKKRR